MSGIDRDQLATDVACASAAYVHNMWEQYSQLPATDRFERLKDVFQTAFLAYHDGLRGWATPTPSRN